MARKNAIAAFEALLAGKDKSGATISVIQGVVFSYAEPIATIEPNGKRDTLRIATSDTASRWSQTTQVQANGLAACAQSAGMRVIEGAVSVS